MTTAADSYVRERLAEMQLDIEELRAENEQLKALVGVLSDSVDNLCGLMNRHRMHHEAVEEMMGKPVTQAIVNKLWYAADARHREQQSQSREAKMRVITEV